MKMSRSTNYAACAVPFMRRCCMAGTEGPTGISSFHVLITTDFSVRQHLLRIAIGYTQVG